MKEAFGIVETHIKSERDMEKRKMDQKPRLQPFEAGGKVLVLNLAKRKHFGNRKCLKF